MCGAFNMACTIAMCGLLVEPQQIALSMTLVTVSFSVSTGIGPLLGGVLTTYAGWQYAFFINIAFGGVSLILSLKYLPKTPKLV